MKKILLNYNKLNINWEKSSAIVNKAFPGNFNLSFIEEFMISNYGSYIEIKTNNWLSKIQNIIRINDFVKIINSIQNNDDFHNTHISSFKMLGTGFLLSTIKNNICYYKLLVKKFFEILEKHHIDRDYIYIKICKGGNIKELSGDKYDINKNIPQDNLSKEIFSDFDVKFLYDQTRDTFLSLNLYQKTSPWGYRVEVLYKRKNILIELATFEYFLWEPIKNNEGVIIDIKHFNKGLLLMGIGFERLQMISNNLNSIIELDYINKHIHFIETLTSLPFTTSRIIYESISCLIIIYNEYSYTELKGHRKDKIKQIEKFLFPIIIQNNIDSVILMKIIKNLIEMENSIQSNFENETNLITSYQVIFDRFYQRLVKFRQDKYGDNFL